MGGEAWGRGRAGREGGRGWGWSTSCLFCSRVSMCSRSLCPVTGLTSPVAWFPAQTLVPPVMPPPGKGVTVLGVGQGQVLWADARLVGYKPGSRLLRVCVSGSQGSPCPALLSGQEWALRCKAFLGERGARSWGAHPSLEPLHLWPGGGVKACPFLWPRGWGAGVRSWPRSSGRTGSRSAELNTSASSCPSPAPWRRCWLRSTPPSQTSSQPW